MRNNIEGIAFDLDGTLYPTYSLNIRLIPFIIKEWRFLLAFGKARDKIRACQEQELAEGPGEPGSGRSSSNESTPAPETLYDTQARLVARILKIADQDGKGAARVKERIETLIYRGWEPFFKKIKLFRHVRETLSAFRQGSLKLGLLSDFPPEQKLEYLGLDGFWDAVLCSERENKLKPHPLPFQSLSRAMGLSPDRILYVGNSRLYDAEGAKRAGMKAALIRPFRFAPAAAGRSVDFIFQDYRQLQKYMLI
jgi:putative hydrolase of the HAD superfamily